MKSGMRSLEMVIRNYSSKKEFFDILGLPLTASKKEIKSKYYELAQKHHPDKAKLGKSDFLKIKNAYEILVCKDQAPKDISFTSHPNGHSNYSSFEPSKIITRPVLMGIGGLLITVVVLGQTLLESRAQAIEDAWERYSEERSYDGLDTVLGYTSNEKKKSTK